MYDIDDIPISSIMADNSLLTRRNTEILQTFLNKIGVPDTLQEFVIDLYIAGNFRSSDEIKELNLYKIARCVTTDPEIFKLVYYRLKRKSPLFFEWQSYQSITLIRREIVNKKEKDKYKTRIKYQFHLLDDLNMLFELPLETSREEMQSIMRDILENTSRAAKPKKSKPKDKADAAFKKMVKGMQEYLLHSGSVDLTAFAIENAMETAYEFPNSKIIKKILKDTIT